MVSALRVVGNYLSLVKFSHTIFAMPFAIYAFFMAMSINRLQMDWMLLLWVVLAMVFARTAAMGFNRYLDRSFDAENERTRQREIPSGAIDAGMALTISLLSALAFVGMAFLINTICFYLSPVALLVILGYSYTKRFTFLCHLILGIGLGLAPVGAWLAVTGHFALLPVLLGIAVLTWVAGFDVIYALQDMDFDKSHRLNSIPAIFGLEHSLWISGLLHIVTAALLVSLGLYGDFGWIFWSGVSVFIGALMYQHLIVKPGNLSAINLAFFATNGIASVIFGIFATLSLFFD